MAEWFEHDPAGAGDGPEEADSSRRTFLLASLGVLLTGCSPSSRALRAMPSPTWDARPMAYVPPAETVAEPAVGRPTVGGSPIAGVLARGRWARGRPVPALMNRMLPVRRITVHHDGMQPFTDATAEGAARRLEAIRRGHRSRGWGDIGYHYAIDRAGNVWEGRPLVYQGAHVKNHNEYNIGVVALGNFDLQEPSEAQVAALRRHVRALMGHYRVGVPQLFTHQELGPTACPGRAMQRYMVAARRNGTFGMA
jgi:hypothetical protein